MVAEPLTSTQAGRRTAVTAWAWATLAFFLIVILEGAVVRATSSGAGCGDRWPLCNGEILPHHPRLATIIEFTHRSLTGISSTMFFVLAGWTFLTTPRRHPARRAALIALFLLLTEGALGAVLVLGHYVERNISAARVLVQSVHFANTMLLLAATTALAVLLGGRSRVPGGGPGPLKLPTLATLLATLVAGAAGSVAALADTLFPSASLRAALLADFAPQSPLLIRMRWMHPAATLLIVVGTLWLTARLRERGKAGAANLLLANLLLQFAIGVADVLLLAPVWIQVLHLLGADLFWITLCALAVPILFPAAAGVAAAESEPRHSSAAPALNVAVR